MKLVVLVAAIAAAGLVALWAAGRHGWDRYGYRPWRYNGRWVEPEDGVQPSDPYAWMWVERLERIRAAAAQ